MSTLHLLSHSPFTDSRFNSCLSLLRAGDALLLSGDAVYAVQPGAAPQAALQALGSEIALFALQEDLSARGLKPFARVQGLDYAGFVELCTRHARVNSWL